jgi:hypothetical protein
MLRSSSYMRVPTAGINDLPAAATSSYHHQHQPPSAIRHGMSWPERADSRARAPPASPAMPPLSGGGGGGSLAAERMSASDALVSRLRAESQAAASAVQAMHARLGRELQAQDTRRESARAAQGAAATARRVEADAALVRQPELSALGLDISSALGSSRGGGVGVAAAAAAPEGISAVAPPRPTALGGDVVM